MSTANRATNGEPFQTNTSEIVRRHLQDVNHKITDEEIRSIQIGGTLLFGERTPQTLEGRAEGRWTNQ